MMLNKDFRYLPWFFLAIVLLIPIGFDRYFTRLLNSEPTGFIINIHMITMSIWCLILLLQPLLIINKKYQLHQTLGKLTTWFMPILLVIMYLTIGRPLANGFSPEIAANIFMPFAHMIIFATFYLLALRNKFSREVHLRYIIISSMALIGPTIGRIDFGWLSNIEGGLELLLIDLILGLFLFFDILRKNNVQPFLFGLSAYVLVHISTMAFAYSQVWQNLTLILYP